MLNSEQLTVAYMTLPTERKDWLEELLAAFRGTEFTPIEFPGQDGRLGDARIAMLRSITTPLVYIMDPDDLVYPHVLRTQLRTMIENPNLSMCGCRERSITADGRQLTSSHSKAFSLDRFKRSPLELHNGTVIRMSAVAEVLDVVEQGNFYNFDWALRLAIASKYPVGKVDEVGYIFRRKANSHHQALNVPEHMTHPQHTVQKLRELGFSL